MDFESLISKAVEDGVKKAMVEVRGSTIPEKFYSPEMIAELLGEVDSSTVRRWCNEGTIKAKKFGKFIRVHPDDLAEFLNDESKRVV